jgi:RNA polymerase sigma-70 factor (ECF subfamily)
LALVRGVLRGEPGAATQFIQHMQCVPHILSERNRRRGKPFDEDELADLVQEVLATVWEHLPRFEGRSSLTTWCYAFCVNKLQNAIRTKRKRPNPASAQAEFVLENAPWHPDDDYSDRFEPVYRCLCQLPERSARVIQLRFFEELSFEQIGRRLGLPENTVKTHYYRGIESLRSQLRRGTTMRQMEESL